MTYVTAYQPQPVSFVRGEGVWLYDDADNAYLDALSGIAVCGLGHAHPAVTETIRQQAGKLIHTSNIYQIPQQQQLAAKLCELTGMQQAFFANSGCEANEAAIKVARLFGHQKLGLQEPKIVVMTTAFHGRTMATLTASAGKAGQEGYEPLLPGFLRAPFNDIGALEQLAQQHNDIAAILVEPIQGEGGLHVPGPGYLKSLRQLCDDQNWCLILDEVQTGNGRTGAWFAFQHENIYPDLLATAKGLGNGFPIGVCLMRDKANDLFQPGKHGSTFGGNPLACAVGLTVLDTIEQNNLVENAAHMGELLKNKLSEELANVAAVQDIRGKGLMIGVELDRPSRPMMKVGLKHKILFNVTADKVVRLLPPLIINEQDVAEIVKRLGVCIREFTA